MAEVGRNEACPCGSGKKFKRCCADGRPASAASVPVILDFTHRSERPTSLQVVPKPNPEKRSIDLENFTEAELLELNRKIAERVRHLRRVKTHRRMLDFRVGERVAFHPADRGHVEGVLIRLNQKTVTVITDDGEHWNVSPEVLQHTRRDESSAKGE